jgi:hypothetical protein
LTPVLVTTYNRILGGGEVPRSFEAAVVVPLPKNGTSSDPHDYRPIALLQSVYKIFTKLMAARLQRCLGEIINEDQRGFVRGREMANNIYIMQAILDQEYDFEDDNAASSPAVLLFDFRKAYDTLRRDFLAKVLVRFGFQQDFIDLIEKLHAHTTARFLVNGDLSRVVEVNSGIRQGCPLAPLLFLIAVEPLKHTIAQAEGVEGIQLVGPQCEYVHGWSAFVDDSVVFVKRGEMLHQVVTSLATFAKVSGLHVQPRKSHLILLNPRCTLDEYAGIPVVPPG